MKTTFLEFIFEFNWNFVWDSTCWTCSFERSLMLHIYFFLLNQQKLGNSAKIAGKFYWSFFQYVTIPSYHYTGTVGAIRIALSHDRVQLLFNNIFVFNEPLGRLLRNVIRIRLHPAMSFRRINTTTLAFMCKLSVIINCGLTVPLSTIMFSLYH